MGDTLQSYQVVRIRDKVEQMTGRLDLESRGDQNFINRSW